MTKLIPLLLLVSVIVSCSNNNNSDSKNIDNPKENTDSVLNPSPHQEETAVSSVEEIEPGDIPLDSLLSFNSEDELKRVFGDNIKRSTGYYPEGMGEYNNTLLFPDSKNEIEFVWADDSLTFSGLLYFQLHGKNTNWKTKDGITIGSNLKTLEELNGKPFTFFGLGWDFSGMINWQKGHLEDRKITGSIAYPEDIMPIEFEGLYGDHDISSKSELALKAQLILGEMTLSKTE